MKKYLIGIILLMASIMALAACGEPPLENACNDLNAITPAAQTDEESSELAEAVTSGVAAEYDAEKDQLVIGITGGAELDPIFETLNKDIADQEVGTIIFLLDGTMGNGYENDLDQKISELSCTSMEKLGLNYPILDAETHNWTGLSAKTDKLYIDSPPSVFETYTDTDKQNLAGFTEVAGISHTISTQTSGGRGFTAIIVAWLAKLNPFIMIIYSFLIVFLDKGAVQIASDFNLNEYASDTITGILLFCILASEFFTSYQIVFRHKEEQ